MVFILVIYYLDIDEMQGILLAELLLTTALMLRIIILNN